MVLETDIDACQTKGLGDELGVQYPLDRHRQLRRVEPGLATLVAGFDDAAHRADRFFQRQQDIVGAGLVPFQCQQHRGADCRVAGKGQFLARREDPELGAMRGALRRQHEHRLGKVEFAGDPLHRHIVEPIAVENDCERIAFQDRLGEDVENRVAPRHRLA